MDLHPIQGGVVILLVASCYHSGNCDKLWLNKLIDSSAEYCFVTLFSFLINESEIYIT